MLCISMSQILEKHYMQITEFCGISFLQWKFNIQNLTWEIMIVPTHAHAHTHTLQLFRKLPDCEKEKGLSELPYILNWVHSNTNLIFQKLVVSRTETTSDSD